MRPKKIYVTALRSVIGIILAVFLIYRIIESTGDGIRETLYQADHGLIMIVLILQGLVAGIASFRWNLLLKVQGIFLNGWKIIRLTFIGIFFNLGLPGAVSGDFFKMYLLTQNTRGKKDEAILTIVMDRVMGLIGLFIVAFLAIILSVPLILKIEQHTYVINIIAYSVGLGSLAGIIFLGLIKTRRKIFQLPLFCSVTDYMRHTFPSSIIQHVERIVDALELYRRNGKSLFASIGLSVLIHLILAINLYFIGVSIGERSLTVSNYFLIVPVANAVAAVPLTPGGIGTRDATIAMFLSALNVSTDKVGAIPVIMTSIILFWGLVGCIIFILTKRQTYKIQYGREAIRTNGKCEN
jgi:uncharacterized protein (TIRG00374 family)